MIEFYVNDEQGNLQEVSHFCNHSWVNVSSPNQEDIDYLLNELQVPEDFMNYVLDRDESARIEKDNDTNVTLVIYDIPYFNEDSEDSIYSTIPMSFLIFEKKIKKLIGFK